MLAVGAVVGHNAKGVRASSELVLKNEEILVSEADDGGYFNASCVKSLSNGHCDSATNAAANDANLLEAIEVGCYAERTNEIFDVVALFLVAELFGGASNDLEDDLNCAGFLVGACNGKRDALALLINAKDDELTGLCLVSNKGSLDLELNDGGVQNLFFNDSVHFISLFNKKFCGLGVKTSFLPIKSYNYNIYNAYCQAELANRRKVDRKFTIQCPKRNRRHLPSVSFM